MSCSRSEVKLAAVRLPSRNIQKTKMAVPPKRNAILKPMRC